MIELMVVLFLLMTFKRMVIMVLILMRVGRILGNGYGQYYADLLQRSEMSLLHF